MNTREENNGPSGRVLNILRSRHPHAKDTYEEAKQVGGLDGRSLSALTYLLPLYHLTSSCPFFVANTSGVCRIVVSVRGLLGAHP